MPRLRNSVTGAVVEVGDEVASRLGSAWVPAEKSTSEKSTTRRARKSDDD